MSGSSTGQIAGAVVGAVVGFFVGGPAGSAAGWSWGMAATVAGSAISGASVGYAIGGMIDPPSPPGMDVVDMEGPKIDSIRVNMPSEGGPVHYVLGPQIRIAGNIIWAGDMIERRVEI